MEEHPDWSEIIQPGLDKLGDYENRLTNTHIVALGKFFFNLYFIAFDPQNKLSFYRENSGDDSVSFETARKIFLDAVCCK